MIWETEIQISTLLCKFVNLWMLVTKSIKSNGLLNNFLKFMILKLMLLILTLPHFISVFSFVLVILLPETQVIAPSVAETG